ncbi:B12-binding domain-containing radical SAM protein [Clostridium perfringens]|nr:B12-binding domain-containing radical SAM protein [Clostridium perfringens]
MKILMTAMPIEISKKRDMLSMRVAPTSAIYLLTSILLKNDYDTKVLDPYTIQMETYLKNLEDILEEYTKDIDVLCISSNTLNWALTKQAIDIIKRQKGNKIKVIVGGLHPSYFYKHIIENTEADFILRGDGEETLPKLIKAIENNTGFENIQGLVCKNKKVSNINLQVPIITNEIYETLPLPAFDMMPKNVYNMLPIETSRGCKFSCKFCSVPHRHDWRGFDPDVVIKRNKEIIKKYQKNFNTSQIFVSDDCLTADFKRAVKILNGLFELDSKSKYIIETRATDWLKNDSEYAVPTFLNDQVVRLAFGIECGYNSGLKMISKGLTIEDVEETINFLEKNKLIHKAFFSFIIGFPWESIDECLETIKFAASIEARFGYGIVNLNWLRLYPSNLWDERRKYGIMIDEDAFDDPLYDSVKYFSLTHPNISPSEREYLNKVIEEYEEKGIYLRNY